MAVPSSSVEFAWQAAENLSEGGVVRLLMTALQQLECLLMTTFPRTERLLMTILCSACQCFFLLCLFQLIFWAILLYYTSMSLSARSLFVCYSVIPCCQTRPKFVHLCHVCDLCFSKLLHVIVKVVICICQSCYMHLSRFVNIFLNLWQTKLSLNLKKIFKIDRLSAIGMEAKFSQNFLPCSANLQKLLFLCKYHCDCLRMEIIIIEQTFCPVN